MTPQPGFCAQHGVALRSASDEPLLGQMVGSYRVARLLGRGGMGEVYLAVQPNIGSRVAIKVLSHECSERQALVERFFAEARAVNVIRHDNIVSVIDLARLPDGRPYIVMEFLEGATLSELLRQRGAFPFGTLTQVLTAILEALGAAHAHGIVHRDLKPDNVHVSAAGRIKVLDFGIAKLRPELGMLSDETRTGALLGTPHYMSPEQARGLPVDARSDLYSLGVIAYELCTGRRPFEGNSLYDLLRLHVEHAPPQMAGFRPGVPAALESIVLRALEKDPARRFQSASEMISALYAVSSALPTDSWVPLASGVVAGSAATQRSSGTPVAHSPLPAAVSAPTPGAASFTNPGLSHTHPPRDGERSFFRYFVVAVAGLVAVAGMGTAVVLGIIYLTAQRSAVAAVEREESLDESPPADTLAGDAEPGEATSTVHGTSNLAGRYTITAGSNPGVATGNYVGEVTLGEVGPYFNIDWDMPNAPAYGGVAIEKDGLLGAGWASSRKVGVIIYEIKGDRLEGTWAAPGVTTTLGKEVLQGPSDLNGTFTIIDAYSPGAHRSYRGKVKITPTGSTYQVKWTLPNESYEGIGIKDGSHLVVGWGGQRGIGVVAYRIRGKRLEGAWAQQGGTAKGHETLERR